MCVGGGIKGFGIQTNNFICLAIKSLKFKKIYLTITICSSKRVGRSSATALYNFVKKYFFLFVLAKVMIDCVSREGRLH